MNDYADYASPDNATLQFGRFRCAHKGDSMSVYYRDEFVTLHHGDCRDILPSMRADAIVTDPPYGTEGLGRGYGRRQLAKGVEDGDSWTIEGDADLSVFTAAAALWRQSVPADAWCIAFCSPRMRRAAEDVLIASGASIEGEALWDKGRPGMGYTIRYGHETALVARYGEPKVTGTPLLSVLRGYRTTEVMADRHPHEKPVEVMSRLIEFAAPLGGVILDPFCGSGSTLRAAKDSGRRAIGIELSELWCARTVERLAQNVLDFGGAA